MSVLRDTYTHNIKEAAKFREFLRLIPKVMVIYAADSAITRAVMPDTKNYTIGSPVTGNLMPHDTSNAAWNWRIGLDGAMDKPLYEKGKFPIGEKFDQHSTNNMPLARQIGIDRRVLDINKKLYNKLFSGNNAKSAKTPKISLYNNIGDISGMGEIYEERANIKAVGAELYSYAAIGAQFSATLINSFMQSGAGSAPNALGLLAELKNGQASHFVKWNK